MAIIKIMKNHGSDKRRTDAKAAKQACARALFGCPAALRLPDGNGGGRVRQRDNHLVYVERG